MKDQLANIISSRTKTQKSHGDVAIDLRKMHNHYGFDEDPFDLTQLVGRIEFLQEELDEIKKSFSENDAEGIVDGLIDLIVVAVGTLDRAKVDFWKAWDAVYSANMAKQRGTNDKRPNASGVDLVKPEGWKPPSHRDNLGTLPEILDSDKDLRHFVDEISSSIDEETSQSEDWDMAIDNPREAIFVFLECIDLMSKKSRDYNSVHSNIAAADYYPFGIESIYQMLHTKMLRIRSVMEIVKSGANQNFESLEDSLKDLMVYASFGVEWLRKKMQGQNRENDIFNRRIHNDK